MTSPNGSHGEPSGDSPPTEAPPADEQGRRPVSVEPVEAASPAREASWRDDASQPPPDPWDFWQRWVHWAEGNNLEGGFPGTMPGRRFRGPHPRPPHPPHPLHPPHHVGPGFGGPEWWGPHRGRGHPPKGFRHHPRRLWPPPPHGHHHPWMQAPYGGPEGAEWRSAGEESQAGSGNGFRDIQGLNGGGGARDEAAGSRDGLESQKEGEAGQAEADTGSPTRSTTGADAGGHEAFPTLPPYPPFPPFLPPLGGLQLQPVLSPGSLPPPHPPHSPLFGFQPYDRHMLEAHLAALHATYQRGQPEVPASEGSVEVRSDPKDRYCSVTESGESSGVDPKLEKSKSEGGQEGSGRKHKLILEEQRYPWKRGRAKEEGGHLRARRDRDVRAELERRTVEKLTAELAKQAAPSVGSTAEPLTASVRELLCTGAADVASVRTSANGAFVPASCSAEKVVGAEPASTTEGKGDMAVDGGRAGEEDAEMEDAAREEDGGGNALQTDEKEDLVKDADDGTEKIDSPEGSLSGLRQDTGGNRRVIDLEQIPPEEEEEQQVLKEGFSGKMRQADSLTKADSCDSEFAGEKPPAKLRIAGPSSENGRRVKQAGPPAGLVSGAGISKTVEALKVQELPVSARTAADTIAHSRDDPRLVTYMKRLGLSEYTAVLTAAWVDMDELPRLSLEELRQLGLPEEVCRKVRKALGATNGQGDPEVAAFLETLGLGKFAPLLAEQWVDMAELICMDESELLQLGMPTGAAKRLLRGLTRVKRGAGTPLPRGPPSVAPGLHHSPGHQPPPAMFHNHPHQPLSQTHMSAPWGRPRMPPPHLAGKGLGIGYTFGKEEHSQRSNGQQEAGQWSSLRSTSVSAVSGSQSMADVTATSGSPLMTSSFSRRSPKAIADALAAAQAVAVKAAAAQDVAEQPQVAGAVSELATAAKALLELLQKQSLS